MKAKPPPGPKASWEKKPINYSDSEISAFDYFYVEAGYPLDSYKS
jgi:hypothetical protein